MALSAGVLSMVMVLLAPGLEPGGMVFGWDTVGEHFAWESWVWERYRAGRNALWNSHVSCGFPFPAQGTTGVFYPLAFPHLFLSHGQAADVILILHLWILAAGCAAFVRCVGGGMAGALFAALAALVAGPITGSIVLGGRAQTFALAWIPWMLVAAERGVRTGRLRWFVSAGGAVGLSLLAGQPFASVQGMLACAVYTWMRCAGGPRSRMPLPTVAFLRSSVAALVAGLVAAPQLAAWLEYRSRAGGGGELPPPLLGVGALPPRQLVTLLFPGFFGDEVSNPYWGHFLLSVLNPYLGWLTLVVAPAGLASRFRRIAAVLLAIGCGSMLLAMGEHVPVLQAIWHRLPAVGALHFPARWLGLGAISMAIVGGLGVASLVVAPASDRGWLLVHRFASGLGLLALALAVVLSVGGRDGVPTIWARLFWAAQADPLRAAAMQDRPPEAWIGEAYSSSRGAMARGLAVAAAALAALRVAPRLAPAGRAALLVGLLAADAGGVAWRYVAHVAPADVQLPVSLIHRITEDGRPFRYAATLSPLDTPGPRGLVRHFAGLDQYGQMSMHAGMLSGVDSLQWGSYGLEQVNDVLNGGTIFAQGFPNDRRWLDAVGVRWLLAPAGVATAADLDALRVSPESRGFEELRKVEETPHYTLFENPGARPRARLIRDPVFVADAPELRARMDQAGFDPASEVVVLERDRPPGFDVDAPPSGAMALDWTQRDDGELAFEVSASRPALLMVSESVYPGWHVTVSGEPREPVAVDGAFLGAFVPAGFSTVEFRYRPVWLWPSLAASMLGVSVIGIAWLGTKARSRFVRRSESLAVLGAP